MFSKMLLLYNALPKCELWIALIIPKSLIIGEASDNTPKIKYTTTKPFNNPNTKPPDLLNVLIIGKFAINSAKNRNKNNMNLAIINSTSIVPT